MLQILVTELGDETFIIAAIMAMRHPRLTVYAGAMAALTAMTVYCRLFSCTNTCFTLTCHLHTIPPSALLAQSLQQQWRCPFHQSKLSPFCSATRTMHVTEMD